MKERPKKVKGSSKNKKDRLIWAWAVLAIIVLAGLGIIYSFADKKSDDNLKADSLISVPDESATDQESEQKRDVMEVDPNANSEDQGAIDEFYLNETTQGSEKQI